jgi:ligand-binding sensor domain-containing protein
VEQVCTTAQGLPDNEVSALMPVGDGALWVGTADGLARLAIVYGPGGD